MAALNREELHVSVTDPVSASMNFLNEIAERFPDAISLAAGRPYDGFFDAGDLSRYLDAFTGPPAPTGPFGARRSRRR